MTTIEKAARALAERRRTAPYDDIDLARAALQAIRVPDTRMIDWGSNHGPMYDDIGVDYEAVFTAMIDAILEEKPE